MRFAFTLVTVLGAGVLPSAVCISQAPADAGPAEVAGFVIPTVSVGNPRNAGDTQLQGIFGAVDYVYAIGTYEVTSGQYAALLNAVAATDTYALYHVNMWTHAQGCKIQRSGTPGRYTYGVAPDWANRPVNFVSFGDALRFANWMHNGQPTGAQDLTTTEDGSYFLNGMAADHELKELAREPDATWVVPSEDEWYKAAYHANDGKTGNYFSYPMGVNFGISNDLANPDPGGHATYYNHPNDFTIGGPYYRTEPGAHENSASPYGTFDQGGNVMEWNESIPLFGGRGLRGGAYLGSSDLLGAWSRPIEYHSSDEFSDIGFRVANVAEMKQCNADLNGDGAVGGMDLAQLLAAWTGASLYAPCPPFRPGDLNQDCSINGLDLASLLAGWGPCP